MYLRCLTSIELYSNAHYYCSHPLIEQQHSQGAFLSKENALMMCLSDVALNEFTKEEPVKAVLAEALNNAQNQFYSSFIQVLLSYL